MDGGWKERLAPLVAGQWGPVFVAVVAAALAIPVVAWSLTFAPQEWQPPSFLEALLVTIPAVLAAGILGGLLGGLVRRTRPVFGAFVAIAVSWAVGIIVLPAAATVFGVTLRIGIVCISTCTSTLMDGSLANGVYAYLSTLLMSVVFLLPAGAGILLLIVAFVAARRQERAAGIVLAVAGHTALVVFSVWMGGFWAYVGLVLGFIAWERVLPRPAPAPAPTVPAPGGEPPVSTSVSA